MNTRGWVGAAVALALAAPVERASALPINTYSVQPVTYAWIDIERPANVLALTGDDEGAPGQAIGFTFPFYGTPRTTVGVSTNGYLSFSSSLTTYSNVPIPDASTPNALIAPFWDDLYVGSPGTIYTATVGAAPRRRFVVTWKHVDFYANPGNLGFQAILDEFDGAITFQYQDMLSRDAARGGGNSATIGIEDDAGAHGTAFSYERTSISNGFAIRFSSARDSDGDGISDDWELRYGFDPLDPLDPPPGQDVDQDGLDFLGEFRAGTDPFVADTDHDGLLDGAEVALGTNPLVADTDGDGASDGAEVQAGTDPLHDNTPHATLVRFGPAELFGQAYFRYEVSASTPVNALRVYFGPVSGHTRSDYAAHVDVPYPGAGLGVGYLDHTWLPGVPQVYFRLAPLYSQSGLTFEGATLSDEGATYFAGDKPGTFPEQNGVPGQTVTEHTGCSSSGQAGALPALLLTATALLAGRRRRRA